jgi:predicted RNA-binding protein with PIN domain
VAIHIIIDGYNLIRQSAVLDPIDQADIQQGRAALLERLAAYKRIKGHAITVVFDGTNAPPLAADREQVSGIRVRFSRHGELADQVIKKIALGEKQRALVVSSDRDVARFVASVGASIISSPEFEARLEMAEAVGGDDIEEESASHGWVPTTKKKGPSRRRSKKKYRQHRVRLNKL